MCEGHLLSGSRGFSGELGHMTFGFASGRSCGCGRKGCLQTVASAKGIVDTALKFLNEKDYDSSLKKLPLEKLTSKTIYEAALQGDEVAREVFQFTGYCLGKAAAEFASISDPEAIILFGGVANAGDLILEPMKKSFYENSLHLYRNHTQLMISDINENDAAILGAASLVYD